MTLRTTFHQLPPRLAAGAFILNSGLTKLGSDEETAKRLHAMAAEAYPLLDAIDPTRFAKALAITEVALGGALLVPLVPSRLVGLGLAAFAGGLVGLYLKTPGLTQPGSIRPSRHGTALAKDVWMLGIALSLVLDRGRRPHTGAIA
jgi:uncharacterized membrane protein YkgB